MSRSKRPGEKVLTANPLSSVNLSEKLKSGVLPIDEEGNLKCTPVIIVDPSSNPSEIGVSTGISTELAAGVYPLLRVASVETIYNPTLFTYSPVRTPSAFKNVTALNAGTTAIWTSPAGKKWRLMGICVTLMKGTTAAAASKLTILDVAADTGIGVDICAGAMTAAPGGLILLQGDFKNGILAAANNTALNANLSTALAAGGVSIQVWGTEE